MAALVASIVITVLLAVLVALAFVAWRRYLWAAEEVPPADTCPYSLTDVLGRNHLVNAPHQHGVRWLTEVFSRSAQRFPDLPALQIPHTGETLSFAELDARAESVAAALTPYVTGPDQVVAVAMSQDNWQIVAAHLGILRAGGTVMLLDTTLPDALIAHMLNDARPVVILTRGQAQFRDLPTLDLLTLPEHPPASAQRPRPVWLDDPAQRLAAIFYTSGTTGMPKGVECPHAGYVNLALSYADYFDLLPGMDATTLTSSLGYDGSMTEMYSAWVSGCAVVMLTKEQVRSGPDLVPILREAEVTVLFCPPVLLTTLTQSPEVDLPYPLCRYIVPAGEAFPSALVEPWTRGRRQIINTYGPTEASTDTSRQTLRPGEPITIGSPFPNVTYVILEEGGLAPLPHGETGELCIGGVHVARGYRNLPEQTAQRFIDHPRFGRLYRTGDRCRIDGKTHQVHFLGRIDAQLKVRGHRVEAQAVEDILQTQVSEIEAAVLDYQNETLIAFVSAPSVATQPVSGVAPAPAAWAARVRALLAEQLPPPSVPSRIFLVERFVMKPVSGKIDRKCLPDLTNLLQGAGPEAEAAPAETPAAARPITRRVVNPPSTDTAVAMTPECEEVLALCRSIFETPLGPDDGFAEAGGHSILIARLAQKLQAAGWTVPVRALLGDCNTARKVARRPRASQLAVSAPQAGTKPPAGGRKRDEAAAEVLSVRHFTALQALFSALMYAPMLAALAVLAYVDLGLLLATADLGILIGIGIALYVLGLALPFASLLWVMLIKRIMGGHAYKNNVTPGVYPKWSRMHFRVWCIARLEASVLAPLGAMYRSAPLMAFALRHLGASVGRNLQCASNASLSGPLDLISIGDDVAIQPGAYVHTTRWADQELLIGPIRLESGCKIGMRAAVGGNVTVGQGTWITPFTPILSDVGAHEMWEGAPARLGGRYTELKRTASASRQAAPTWLLETGNVLMQVLVFLCVNLIPTAVILWLARDLLPMGEGALAWTYFQATPLHVIALHLALYALASGWAIVVVTSVLTCLFIRWTAFSPGLYASGGLKGALLLYRLTLMNALQNRWTWTITGQYLRALAGMRFSRVGASECDLMNNLVPEMVTADAQVFWSNGCYTNMLDYGAQHITLRQVDMPRNFFSGNNCVVEHGQLPSNFLLGVSTPASDIAFRRQMRSRLGEPITVAGNPPVRFATAPSANDDAHCPPGFPLFLARVALNDLVGIGLLRVVEGFVFTVVLLSLIRLEVPAAAGAIAAFLITEAGLILLSVALKKALVGSEWGADHATPFWSWRHFAYFFAQDCFFVWCRGPLAFCAGTAMANPILRWMGCRIGKRTIVTQPLQCFDWNAVSFGNDCMVDGFLQFHTFEDMRLKVKRSHIGDGSTIAFGATVMGGATIARDTTLLPLSLTLKEMSLLTATYEGSPAEPVSGSMPFTPIVLPRGAEGLVEPVREAAE